MDPTQSPLSAADQQQILELYQHIRRRGAHWVAPDGRSESLADSLPGFLAKLDTSLSAGHWVVALGENPVQVTAAAAARMLGVSRQFVIGQLKKGAIPFHMVGTHYRLYVKDVLAYRMQRDNQWRRTPDPPTHSKAEEGLDDQEPPGDLKPAPQMDSEVPPPQPEPPSLLPPQSTPPPQPLQSTPAPQLTTDTEAHADKQ